jgi:hypothetical protein
LPDGRSILFTLAKGTDPDRWDKAQIVVQAAGSAERKTIVAGVADGRYISTGHIVYALGSTLFAVNFDARRLEVRGEPVPIVDAVGRSMPNNQTGAAQFSISATGSLVYLPGPANPQQGAANLRCSTAAGRSNV